MSDNTVKLDPTIKEQILAVRDTGRTNMFDRIMVQRIAFEMDLYELVNFLEDEDNRSLYSQFIMYGDGEE